jgi:hypothetical protein
MTETRRHLIAGAIVLVSMAGQSAAAAGDETVTHDRRVRSSHAGITALITQAIEQSATFRSLVETVNASDGFVYVEKGKCGHGVRACLANVVSAGKSRFLFVKVDVRQANWTLMASIGHELRHAVEVLSNPRVTNYSTMFFFYQREGIAGFSGAFETQAAVEAGDAVGAEVREYRRRVQAN